jgi:hypothetical protein
LISVDPSPGDKSPPKGQEPMVSARERVTCAFLLNHFSDGRKIGGAAGADFAPHAFPTILKPRKWFAATRIKGDEFRGPSLFDEGNRAREN